MPNWRKLIQSGSDAELNNLYVTNDISASTISASGTIYANLTEQNLAHVVTYNTTTGQLYYTASSGLGGGTAGVTGLNGLAGNLTITSSGVISIGDDESDEITVSADLTGYATETYVLGQTASLSASLSGDIANNLSVITLFGQGVNNVISVNGFDDEITISAGTGIVINESDPNIEISASLNLQQVTDNGNTTTNTLDVGGIRYQGDLDTGVVFTSDRINLNAGGGIYLDINSFQGNDYISMSSDVNITGLLHASTSYDNGTHTNVVVYDTASGRFYHTGSYGVGGASLTGLNKEVVYFNGNNTPASSNGFIFDYNTDNLYISGVYYGKQYASDDVVILDYKAGNVRVGDITNEPTPSPLNLYGDTTSSYHISSSQDIYSSGSKIIHQDYKVPKFNTAVSTPIVGNHLISPFFHNSIEVYSTLYSLPNNSSDASIKLADLNSKINASNIDIWVKFEGPSSNLAIMGLRVSYSRIDNDGLTKVDYYTSYHGDNNILSMFGNIQPETSLSGQLVSFKLKLTNIPFSFQGRNLEVVSKYDSYILPFNI